MSEIDTQSQEFAPREIVLRDGRSVFVREIRPSDSEALEASVERLSSESRYARFMSVMKTLPERMLEAATHPKQDREFALVALDADGVGDDEGIVGGARYGSAPGSDECEFAVTVADTWQGCGLARRLMEILIEVARSRGFERMVGYVLTSNVSMRSLAKRLGFVDRACPDDPTLRIVTLQLAG